MTTYTETRLMPYEPGQVFDLVADVESYPEFVPHWSEAMVYRRKGNVYFTEQEINVGLVRDRFRSKTVLKRPGTIEVTASEGFLRNLRIEWRFSRAPNGACRVRFSQSFDSRSALMQVLLDCVLRNNASRVVQAFENRACELYGSH